MWFNNAFIFYIVYYLFLMTLYYLGLIGKPNYLIAAIAIDTVFIVSSFFAIGNIVENWLFVKTYIGGLSGKLIAFFVFAITRFYIYSITFFLDSDNHFVFIGVAIIISAIFNAYGLIAIFKFFNSDTNSKLSK